MIKAGAVLGHGPAAIRAMRLQDWGAIIDGHNEAHNPPVEVMSLDRLAELKARYPDERPNG